MAAEWAETRREPTRNEPGVISVDGFSSVDLFDIPEKIAQLSARGVLPDSSGLFWHKDVRRVFPPNGRGRPRGRGYPVKASVARKASARIAPGRVEALARFIENTERIPRAEVAAHYVYEICGRARVSNPETSNGFPEAYRLALRVIADRVAFIHDTGDVEGAEALERHLANWTRFL